MESMSKSACRCAPCDACSACVVLFVSSAGNVPPACGSGSAAPVLLDARLFLRSSCARFVLARAASRPDAALPVLPAVLMTVVMPSTVLVIVVQNHPSALLATASCRARGTRHACARCT